MEKKIERYAYFPTLSDDKKTYYFKRLKVIAVWVIPQPRTMFDCYRKPYQIVYNLENCYRVYEELLITNIDGLSADREHLKYRTSFGVRRHRTIFSLGTEMEFRYDPIEMAKLEKQSDEHIKWCIKHDEISGEKSINEILNEVWVSSI